MLLSVKKKAQIPPEDFIGAQTHTQTQKHLKENSAATALQQLFVFKMGSGSEGKNKKNENCSKMEQ